MKYKLLAPTIEAYKVGESPVPEWVSQNKDICGDPLGIEGVVCRTAFGPQVAMKGEMVLRDLLTKELTTMKTEDFGLLYEAVELPKEAVKKKTTKKKTTKKKTTKETPPKAKEPEEGPLKEEDTEGEGEAADEE